MHAESETIVTPPLLNAVRDVRWRLGAGHSMKEAFRVYLEDNHDPLAHALRERWVLKMRTGSTSAASTTSLASHYAQAFWELVERGCAGQPIAEALGNLEDEVERAADLELEQHVSTLPFKVLLPLLAFQFPAHLILLVGPMLRDLNHSLGS